MKFIDSYKLQQEIQAYSEIIQHGVDLQGNQNALSSVFAKMSGSLPLGANSPKFETRKKMICSEISLNNAKDFFSAIFLFFVGFVLICCVGFSKDSIQSNWEFLLGGLVAIVIGFFLFRSYLFTRAILKVLRKLEPDTPDIAPREISPEEEIEIKALFANDTRKMRLFALIATLVSGAVLTYIIIDPPHVISQYVFILPVIVMLFLGVTISPMSKAERLHRYGHSQLSWSQMPLVVKVCVVIGGVLSFAFFVWLKSNFQ